jgi:hypothetical protein
MAGILTAVWFAAVLGGALAALAAVLTRRARRRIALLVAGSCFGVAGTLGILSIGIFFLAVAMVCLVVATRIGDESPTAASR